jgi:hypothetical protein
VIEKQNLEDYCDETFRATCNMSTLADTIVADLNDLIISIADPAQSQQKIIRSIYKNRYAERVKDAAKYLYDEGLVPGFREIPFHIDEEVMIGAGAPEG